MAKKATLTDVTDTPNNASAINTNINAVNDKLDNTLSLDGSTPNAMNADFDLNGHDLLNGGSINTTNLYLGGRLVTANSELVISNIVTKKEYLTYSVMVAETGSYTDFAEGDYLRVLNGNYVYLVAPSGATDHQITLAGGVKLYVLDSGGGICVDQFGADPTGATDSTAATQAWCNYIAANGGNYRVTSGGIYNISFDENSTEDPFKQAAVVLEITDNSIPPVDIDFAGSEWFCTGTGTGRVANGAFPYGGVGERGAAFRFSKPIQANRSMRAEVRNLELDMSGFTNPIAGLIFDDWEKASISRVTVKDFNPEDDWSFAVTIRNIYQYSERTDWRNINHVGSTGGCMGWFGAAKTVFPVTHTDWNGDVRTAGDAVPGTESFARTTVTKVTGAASKTGNAYAMAILGGTYDSTFTQLDFNGGNIAIVYYEGVGGGTTIDKVTSEQPRSVQNLTGSIDTGVSATTLTITTSDFADHLAFGSGAWVTVAGAGASGADLVTRIDSFTSDTVVELRDAASTTVSGASVTVHSYSGVELSGSSNAPAVIGISAGGSYQQLDLDGYTGSSYDEGSASFKIASNTELFQTSRVKPDETDFDAWDVYKPSGTILKATYPVIYNESSLSVPNSTATEVLGSDLCQAEGNITWKVWVTETGGAFAGECIVKRRQGSNTIDHYPILEDSLTFSTSGGGLRITHSTGNTEAALVSYQRMR